jgi:hypothetical protein
MIGIIGGGFGLYGYLPAVCQKYCDKLILIEIRHKDKFLKRPELSQYSNRILWQNSVNEIINQVELLILAIPPVSVKEYADLIICSPTIKKLIVDKPICENPNTTENFITKIESVGIQLVSSYLFIYTEWVVNLKKDKKCIIEWDIKNNNPINSWKRNNLLGGGEINFYGIHLLSVVAYIFENLNQEMFEFTINPDSTKGKFKVINGTYHYNASSPFGDLRTDEDNRVVYIKKLLDDLENNYKFLNALMKKTNEIWKQIKLK